MSSMNFVGKLLDGVEVEWKPLGDLVKTVTAPTKLKSQSYCDTGKLPIIDQGIEFIAGYTDEEIAPVRAGRYVIFGDHSEHIKYVDFSFVQGADGIKILRPISANAKYIYYALQNFYKKELNYKRHWSSAQETLIPVPCPENQEKSLEIQGEIVRVLDNFTELTTELTARKKQYNYYREKLLSFEDGEVEWKTLGELCSINVGQAPAVNEAGEYPFVNAGTTPSGYVSAYNTEPGTITTPSRGQGGIGYVGYQNTRFWCGPLCYRIRSTSEMLLTRFLYHVMANSMKEIVGLANMTGVPALNKKDLVGFPVPIPSPDEQIRIVTILDKFDALTSSITEGLPREIELRQKQYGYYESEHRTSKCMQFMRW